MSFGQRLAPPDRPALQVPKARRGCRARWGKQVLLARLARKVIPVLLVRKAPPVLQVHKVLRARWVPRVRKGPPVPKVQWEQSDRKVHERRQSMRPRHDAYG